MIKHSGDLDMLHHKALNNDLIAEDTIELFEKIEQEETQHKKEAKPATNRAWRSVEEYQEWKDLHEALGDNDVFLLDDD